MAARWASWHGSLTSTLDQTNRKPASRAATVALVHVEASHTLAAKARRGIHSPLLRRTWVSLPPICGGDGTPPGAHGGLGGGDGDCGWLAVDEEDVEMTMHSTISSTAPTVM